mgnify:CR=1 FL=1
MGDENNGLPNEETAEALIEAAQPGQLGPNSEVMREDPDARYDDLEQNLAGVIVGEIKYADGQVELLVMSIDASLGTPEL